MKIFLFLAGVALTGALVSLPSVAKVEGLADPDSASAVVSPAQTDRERIKAAREKTDREMKLDTRRPWDGQDWGSGTKMNKAKSESPVEKP